MLKRPDGCPKHVWKKALCAYGSVMKETVESKSTPFPMLVRIDAGGGFTDAGGDVGTMMAVCPELNYLSDAIRHAVKALASIIYQNRNDPTRAVAGVLLLSHVAHLKKQWAPGEQVPSYPCIVGDGNLFVCDPDEEFGDDQERLQVRLLALLEYRHERTGQIRLCGWGSGLLHNGEKKLVYSQTTMANTDRLSDMNNKCSMGATCPSMPLKTAEILVGNIDAHLPKNDPSLN